MDQFTVPSVTFVLARPLTKDVRLADVIVSVWLRGKVRNLQSRVVSGSFFCSSIGFSPIDD